MWIVCGSENLAKLEVKTTKGSENNYFGFTEQ